MESSERKIKKMSVVLNPSGNWVKLIHHTEYVNVGDILEGTIGIHLTTETFIKTISIRLHGDDIVYWREGAGTPEKGAMRSYSFTFPVIQAGHTFSKDSTLKFKFEVPEVPDSHNTVGGYKKRSYQFGVMYTISVLAEARDFTLSSLPCEVSIHSPRPSSTDEIDSVERAEAISYCCFNEGKVELSARGETDSFLSGQSVDFDLNVINSSEMRIKYLKIELIRKIVLISFEKNANNFDEFLNSFKFSGIPKLKKIDNIPISIPIPAAAPPSADSSYFKCHYYVRVTAHVRGWQNVTLMIPVRVYTRSEGIGIDKLNTNGNSTAALLQT
jgi:hypothetical protein